MTSVAESKQKLKSSHDLAEFRKKLYFLFFYNNVSLNLFHLKKSNSLLQNDFALKCQALYNKE